MFSKLQWLIIIYNLPSSKSYSYTLVNIIVNSRTGTIANYSTQNAVREILY